MCTINIAEEGVLACVFMSEKDAPIIRASLSFMKKVFNLVVDNMSQYPSVQIVDERVEVLCKRHSSVFKYVKIDGEDFVEVIDYTDRKDELLDDFFSHINKEYRALVYEKSCYAFNNEFNSRKHEKRLIYVDNKLVTGYCIA